jgi:NADP-dependent 3-hydroxy acid dehydrogenase YdfG
MSTSPSLAPRALGGKVAAVTGASRGIGLATAHALAARGMRIAMLARDRETLHAAAAPLGDAAVALAVDVADPGAVQAAFADIDRRLGRLDVLVNNAGTAVLGRIEEVSDADLQAQVATNLLGLVYCMRAAIPRLRAAGGGDIVNVSSTSVTDPYPYLTVYSATKAAVETLSRSVRRETSADGTRVIVLRCGPAWTSFGERWDPETTRRALEVWAQKGYAGLAGAMDPRVVGETIAQAVASPAQASVELLEIAPTIHAPGGPGAVA